MRILLGLLLGIIFIPIVMRGSEVPMGVNIWPGQAELVYSRIKELNPAWIMTEINWATVEEVRGEYNWNPYFDSDWEFIKNREVIITVKMSPIWARSDSRACSEFKEEYLPDFIKFLNKVIERYPEVKYIQIMNEQDAATGEDNYYGCWGDETDEYYGGRYYGSVLRVVYEAISPRVKVLYGGLVLDVNSKFFEGSLLAGAKFDILPFHHYSWYLEPDNELDIEVTFLRETMRKYNLDKPIFLTETSLLCGEGWSACNQDFLQAQADYVDIMKQEVKEQNLSGWLWYALPATGWNNSGLLKPDGTPKPAYYKFIYNK